MNTCLRCGENKSSYCEHCIQEIIAENARLQLIIHQLTENRGYTSENKEEF